MSQTERECNHSLEQIYKHFAYQYGKWSSINFCTNINILQNCIFKATYFDPKYEKNTGITNDNIFVIVRVVMMKYAMSELLMDAECYDKIKKFIDLILNEGRFNNKSDVHKLLNIVCLAHDSRLVKHILEEQKIIIDKNDFTNLTVVIHNDTRYYGRYGRNNVGILNDFFNDVVKIFTDFGYVITEDDIITSLYKQKTIHLKQDVHKLQITNNIYKKCDELEYFPYGRHIRTDVSMPELEKLFLKSGQLPIIKKTIDINKLKPNMQCLINSCKIGCGKYIEFLCDIHKLVPDKVCIIHATYSRRKLQELMCILFRYMPIEQNDKYSKYENLIIRFGLRGYELSVGNYIKTHKLINKKTKKIILDDVLKSFLTLDSYDNVDDIMKEIDSLWNHKEVVKEDSDDELKDDDI